MAKLYGLDALRQERGASTVKTLLILAVVLAVGFFALKAGGAYLDKDGAEADLNAMGTELNLSCIGDRRCETQLIDQIEQLRETHNRDIEYDFSTMQYFSNENRFSIEGSKMIDFVVTQYDWHFTIVVDLL